MVSRGRGEARWCSALTKHGAGIASASCGTPSACALAGVSWGSRGFRRRERTAVAERTSAEPWTSRLVGSSMGRHGRTAVRERPGSERGERFGPGGAMRRLLSDRSPVARGGTPTGSELVPGPPSLPVFWGRVPLGVTGVCKNSGVPGRRKQRARARVVVKLHDPEQREAPTSSGSTLSGESKQLTLPVPVSAMLTVHGPRFIPGGTPVVGLQPFVA